MSIFHAIVCLSVMSVLLVYVYVFVKRPNIVLWAAKNPRLLNKVLN